MRAAAAAPPRVGRLIAVRGAVQGVGFRPFVYRLAVELGLEGTVRNTDGHVVIETAGTEEALDEFVHRIVEDAPPLSHVDSVVLSDLPVAPAANSGFRVAPSDCVDRDSRGELPPDIATCADCLRELFDPADRRYRYPFTNCTNCGPRATIIRDLPYDRERTVMQPFPLCDACAYEYGDPTNRRFHAEPVACAACGPQLAWQPIGSAIKLATGEAALQAAVHAIAAGHIVAVKSLGGYQLICDATNAAAVSLLRERKRRPTKPLAVMVADQVALHEIAEPSATEDELLISDARPIALVQGIGVLPAVVNPGTNRIGVFLPYTPLHHLLLSELARPLVVTSGNRCDEPMAIDNDAGLVTLGGIADGFLMNDRDIAVRYDDSVVQVTGDRPRMIRRARGYAPTALALPVPTRRPLLGVGAELKHTFTLASEARAVIGPHGGDLEDVDSFDSFERTLAHLSRLERIDPEIVAHDLHPGYLSTQFAQRYPARDRMPIQHHHAHIAACAAEFGVTEPVIGIAYDGLGLGDDGTLWGGEVLIANLTGYRRFGRFSRAPMPGGRAAIKRPARMALGYLFGVEGFDDDPGLAAHGDFDPFRGRLGSGEIDTIRRLVGARMGSPFASSAGRLFDAVASLLGLHDDASYEGEAAVALENAAADGDFGEFAWKLRRVDGLLVYDVRPTLDNVIRAVAERADVSVVSARFHQTLIAVTEALCQEARRATGLRTVCLGGGVFQNRRLAAGVIEALVSSEFHVYAGEQVPTNDGGVSFGQSAIAAARTRRD
ncbi:MAG TPA: carbamoyltransferase HypF [Acidothermaceae bacterium]